jgi:hypothetical protein
LNYTGPKDWTAEACPASLMRRAFDACIGQVWRLRDEWRLTHNRVAVVVWLWWGDEAAHVRIGRVHPKVIHTGAIDGTNYAAASAVSIQEGSHRGSDHVDRWVRDGSILVRDDLFARPIPVSVRRIVS